MPKLSQYYNIAGPVPFVDVEVFSDNRLFVDPHAIRLSKSPSPFVSEAIGCVDTFCSEVTNAVITRTPASYRDGEALLQRFTEPSETRLGMAATGFQGHGGSEGIGSLIWQTLTSDVELLVRMGVMRQIEDLPLFVEGVDRDITSDVTTRIIYHPLARFTEAMVQAYPQFTAGGNVAQTYSKQVWDPVGRQWTTADVLLPVVAGKPVLLVPKGWARSTLLMSAGRYYETSVLSFAQLEQAAIDADGKLIKTPKWALRQQTGLQPGRTTSIRVTRRAFESEQDLLKRFKTFVASRLPASDDVVDETAA